jgi:hypothetical protein
MPACRGVYLTNPTTGLPGLWVELSTSAPGVLTGLAVTAWPAVAHNETLASYQSRLQDTFQQLFNLPEGVTPIFGQQPPDGYYSSGGLWYPKIVTVTLTLTDFITIAEVVITEGALRNVNL